MRTKGLIIWEIFEFKWTSAFLSFELVLILHAMLTSSNVHAVTYSMLRTMSEKRYAAKARYTNFYDGRDICWTENGQYIYCLNGDVVNQVDVETSNIVNVFGVNVSQIHEKLKITDELEDIKDNDTIYCFAMSKKHLVSAHASGLLRLWELSTQKIIKLWKCQHKGPVVRIEFSPCEKIVCTSGGADATLRLWDFANNSCLCAVKEFSGPAMLVQFHPSSLKSEILAAGSDNVIYCWNYVTKTLLYKLRGHISQVTGLSFKNTLADCNQLITVGRDKVVIVWKQQFNGEATTWIQSKIIPLYEELEGVIHIAKGCQLLIACGSGKIQSIDTKSWKVRDLSSNADYRISRLLYCKSKKQLALITTEQNIIFFNVSTESDLAYIKLAKQLVGYNDEILDMCFLGDNDRYLAVATNSKQFKLYDTENNMNCQLVSGHSDTVMSLTASHKLLISVGKDCTIHIWKLSHETDYTLQLLTQQENCHTSTIGCVAIEHNGARAFASACQDGTMKVWQLSRDKQDHNSYSFSLRYAVLAHDKEVNCVTYALNNKILATASQDKTAKLWTADSNILLGVLRGHTRGVWCVRFSPVDQIVVTSSSDCTMRIWSMASFSCLKRLEQECTILRVELFDHGKFILSAASDGLLKLWNIKTNICVQSIDEHSDRVWSVAVSSRSNRFFYTGGADSTLIRFEDITEAVHKESLAQRQTILDQEQMLISLLQVREQLEKALKLALSLDKPKASYEICCHFVRKRGVTMYQMIDKLNMDQRLALLQHVKSWVTNSRHSYIANLVLKSLLGNVLFNKTKKLYNRRNLVEALSPYVTRHFKRVTELKKEIAYMEFIIMCM